MKRNDKKKGVALILVLFFAISIFIILFFMSQSNTNLALQNKQALYQMQAYYLAHSASQHAKLHLRLLPRETYDYFENGGIPEEALSYINSSNFSPTSMEGEDVKLGYDLFKANASPKDKFPYGAEYKVDRLDHTGAHENMKMIQDAYELFVSASVWFGKKPSGVTNERSRGADVTLNEEMTISRFTGGS